jgi:hypothetical protein
MSFAIFILISAILIGSLYYFMFVVLYLYYNLLLIRGLKVKEIRGHHSMRKRKKSKQMMMMLKFLKEDVQTTDKLKGSTTEEGTRLTTVMMNRTIMTSLEMQMIQIRLRKKMKVLLLLDLHVIGPRLSKKEYLKLQKR